jgi:pimeloyl-ACP methyl ester carboxylesterase
MKSLIRKTIKWILILFFSIIIGGIVYEQASQFYLNAKRPDDKAFCEIDGRQVHFVKKGTGGPTVVFQSGLGGDYKIWEEIQDTLSAYTTTISYDRAGLQWSDEMEAPRTMDNITDELHQLLEKTNCPKPYILVGHSLAGITLRSFVQQYPEEVGGIVFADVSHPLQIKKSSEELKQYLVVPPTWLISILMESGIARLYFSFQPFIADLPVDHWMNKLYPKLFLQILQNVFKRGYGG